MENIKIYDSEGIIIFKTEDNKMVEKIIEKYITHSFVNTCFISTPLFEAFQYMNVLPLEFHSIDFRDDIVVIMTGEKQKEIITDRIKGVVETREYLAGT